LGEREEGCDGLTSECTGGRIPAQGTARKVTQAGFTLIELIVALVLAGIMMVGALFIYRDFMDTWDRELSSMEMQRQGTYALAEMEEAIKKAIHDDDGGGSIQFVIGNYGGGTDNMLTVTVPDSGGAEDIEYYHDDGVSPEELKRREGAVVTRIIPDVLPETEGEGIEVDALTFTDDTVVGRSIRIDLRLSDSHDQTTEFTSSVRLRNENIQ
jgi:prepilin-type N-terminal cleavage/methylation domain-containing protein